MKKDVLFRYRVINACCAEIGVDDEGFSITFYENGDAEYKTFICFDILKKCIKFTVSEELLKELNKFIEENQTKILSLDSDSDNGSCDGEFNVFTFKQKEFHILNIDKYDLEKVKVRNPEYYKDYYNVMIQENQIMELFDSVCLILKKYGFYLNLNMVRLPLKTHISNLLSKK